MQRNFIQFRACERTQVKFYVQVLTMRKSAAEICDIMVKFLLVSHLRNMKTNLWGLISEIFFSFEV